MIDAKAFGTELAGIVKAATSPIIARLDALEKRLDNMPVPKDGKDADADEVAAIVSGQLRGEIESIMEALEAIEIPEVPELPDIDGMVSEAVSEAVAAIPAPEKGEDGKSVTVDDVAPLIEAQVSKAVAAIPPAKDGVGVAGAMIDRSGNLVLTLSNGETKELGLVVGKDAAPAEPGRDGLGFEDLEFVTDDMGRPVAKFQRGDVVKTVALPCIIDRGPYRTGEKYQKGDAVSYGGSLWIAQDATDEKPDGGKGWRLAVKKGRDARNSDQRGVK